jgi:hypothetical protein
MWELMTSENEFYDYCFETFFKAWDRSDNLWKDERIFRMRFCMETGASVFPVCKPQTYSLAAFSTNQLAQQDSRQHDNGRGSFPAENVQLRDRVVEQADRIVGQAERIQRLEREIDRKNEEHAERVQRLERQNEQKEERIDRLIGLLSSPK